MLEGPAKAVDRERGNADIVGGFPSFIMRGAASTRALHTQRGVHS